MNIQSIVELVIVSACVRMQIHQEADEDFHRYYVSIPAQQHRSQLMEAADRVITIAGYGPDDWEND